MKDRKTKDKNGQLVTGVCCQRRTDTANLTMTCFATEQQPPIRYQQGEEKTQ